MSTSEIPAPESAPIAGFWRRLIALAIDSMVLGIFGSGVGWSLCDVFAGMGAWGRLIGFLIAVTYFGVMNSSIFDGQTFGKRVMKIRVVPMEGQSGVAVDTPQDLERVRAIMAGAAAPNTRKTWLPNTSS